MRPRKGLHSGVPDPAATLVRGRDRRSPQDSPKKNKGDSAASPPGGGEGIRPAFVVGVVGRSRWSRELLGWALGSSLGTTPVDLGTSGPDLPRRVAESRIAVLVLDLHGQEAAAAAAPLIAGDPQLRVLAVSVADRAQDIAALAEAGVHGLLHEEGSFDDLVRSIESIRQGDATCSPRISRTLLRHLLLRSPTASRGWITDLLSPRERQVVRLLERGLSNKEIGERLHIGPGTVKNHVHRILAKRSKHHRWEIIQEADAEIPPAPRAQREPNEQTPD